MAAEGRDRFATFRCSNHLLLLHAWPAYCTFIAGQSSLDLLRLRSVQEGGVPALLLTLSVGVPSDLDRVLGGRQVLRRPVEKVVEAG